MNKHLFMVKRQVNGVRKLLDEIKALRVWYTDRLRDTREELGFRSDQNIISFTYVTVVFLPLGFAASVFSMNASPAGSLVVSMVILAVSALAITVFAIINARAMKGIGKYLSGMKQTIAKAVQEFTEKAIETSIIYYSQQERKTREENKQAVSHEADLPERPPVQASRRIIKSSYWTFWLAYLLIEVPVKFIFLAYRVLAGDGDASIDPARRSIRRAKSHGGNNILRVLGGFLILPIFLISLPFQLLFYNIVDVFVLIRGQ